MLIRTDAVMQIIKRNGGEVDRAVDAVGAKLYYIMVLYPCQALTLCITGYQAVHDDGGKEQPNAILTSLIRVVKPSPSSF